MRILPALIFIVMLTVAIAYAISVSIPKRDYSDLLMSFKRDVIRSLDELKDISKNTSNISLENITVSTINYTDILLSIQTKVDELCSILSNMAQEKCLLIYYVSSSSSANKVHIAVFNNSTRNVRLVRVFASANLTGAVTGYTVAFSVVRFTSYTVTTTIPPSYTPCEIPQGVLAFQGSISGVVRIFPFSINFEETGGGNFVDINLGKGILIKIVL
ncbi:MAG: hypothetical protein QXJ97_09830 [Desulfurococcaceae archaeon]